MALKRRNSTCDPVHTSLPASNHINAVRPSSHGSPSTTADRLPSSDISLLPLSGHALSQTMSHPGNEMSAAHHEPINPIESSSSENPVHSIEQSHFDSGTPVHPFDPAHPTEQSSSRPSPSLRHALSPSPSALVDEPLSTDTLPIPDVPATAEADAAFQQVFDVIEAADHQGTFSDSGYSESVAQSSSTSLSSSVRDFEFENGRRYVSTSGTCQKNSPPYTLYFSMLSAKANIYCQTMTWNKSART